MSILVAFLIISTIFTLAFLFYSRKKRLDRALYPIRKDLLLELIVDLKQMSFGVTLSKIGPEDCSIQLSLFEAKNFLDNKRELAREKYDDYVVCFSDTGKALFNFREYIENKFLPKEVAEELKHFQNTEYALVDPKNPYLIILTENDPDTIYTEENGEILFQGNGEAFDSWLTFKESSHNLNYVIGQWIRENGELNDTILFDQLDFIEK